MNRKENVILFPKLKSNLEKESMEAIQNKDYQVALDKINQLIGYGINTHEIVIGKLICLMEMGNSNEAETICEELLKKRNEHFFEYLHIYVTLLFQSGRYSELVDYLDTILTNEELPHPLKNQLHHIYQLSEELSSQHKEEEGLRLIKELKRAVKQDNPKLQWRTIEMCKGNSVIAAKDYLKDLLLNPSINPVVKTSIIEWMLEQNVNEKIEVEKFGQSISIVPEELNAIRDQSFFKSVLQLLNEMEQKNPTLYVLIEQLLYRYMYVQYPLILSDSELKAAAKALIEIGSHYLQLENNEFDMEIDSEPSTINQYISDMLECDSYYLSIIEE